MVSSQEEGTLDPCLGVGVPLMVGNPDPVKDNTLHFRLILFRTNDKIHTLVLHSFGRVSDLGLLDTVYIHTLLLPPQWGFSGTIT